MSSYFLFSFLDYFSYSKAAVTDCNTTCNPTAKLHDYRLKTHSFAVFLQKISDFDKIFLKKFAYFPKTHYLCTRKSDNDAQTCFSSSVG